MTAVLVALIAGLAPTVAIGASYLLARRDSRAAAQKVATAVATVKETVALTSSAADEKLNEIHVLVNSRLTEALEEIDKLKKALVKEKDGS